MIQSLLNNVCYTVGWFWCVLMGIHGYFLLALIGAIILLSLQLIFAKKYNTRGYIQDLLLALFSIPMGVLLETLLINLGVIHYVNQTTYLPPVWIILLYPLFSLLLNHSLRIIQYHALTIFLFGFLFAPLSYCAGRYLGGVTFYYSDAITWGVLGSIWGLFLIGLCKLSNIIGQAAAETLADRDSCLQFELLYDGECPICDREICLLSKRVPRKSVNFVDIASKEYYPEEHQKIDYESAMQQIHAILGEDLILVGLPAFATLYARCQLLVLSSLLRLPFIKFFLDPLYRLFAKRRLWLTGRGSSYHGRE